jgi:hypothetical protein
MRMIDWIPAVLVSWTTFHRSSTDRLDPRGARVLDHVPPVLDVLDDRQEDRHVPEPNEDPVDPGEGGEILEDVELPGVVREQHDRQLGVDLGDGTAELGHVHLADAQHRDREVEGASLERGEGLLRVGDVHHVRRVAQVELDVLGEQELGQAAVLLEGERVVLARDEEDVAHALEHQGVERDPLLGGVRRDGMCESQLHVG